MGLYFRAYHFIRLTLSSLSLPTLLLYVFLCSNYIVIKTKALFTFWIFLIFKQTKDDIQSGSVSEAFTETVYRVKYIKPIPKEINQDASTVWT